MIRDLERERRRGRAARDDVEARGLRAHVGDEAARARWRRRRLRAGGARGVVVAEVRPRRRVVREPRAVAREEVGLRGDRDASGHADVLDVAARRRLVQDVADRLGDRREERRDLQAARRDHEADAEEVVVGRDALAEVPDHVRRDRGAAVRRRERGDALEREEVVELHAAERQAEAEGLAPVVPHARVHAATAQLPHSRDDVARVGVRGERGARVAEPLAVERVIRPALAHRGDQQDDREDRERGRAGERSRFEQAPEPGGADPDERDRGEVHAADEAVNEERAVEREEVEERSEGRPTEIEDEPHREERDERERETRPQPDRRRDPDPAEEREHGDAARVEQLAGDEPAEDRRRAEGVVERRPDVGAPVGLVDVAGHEQEGHPHVRGDDRDRAGNDRRRADRDTDRRPVTPDERDDEDDPERDRGHVRVQEMREGERAEREDRERVSPAAQDERVERRDREKAQVHGPELRVHAEAAPDVAVVLEAVAMRRRHERCRSRGDTRCDRRQPHPPERPQNGQRERDEQQVAERVEQRHQIDGPEERAVQRDHREVRQVLVVEELGKAELELRHPGIEGVLAAREGLARALDEHEVLGVVVDVRDGDRDLGEERDRVERDREGDEERAKGALDLRQRSGEGLTAPSVSGSPGAAASPTASAERAWDRDAARSRAPAARPRYRRRRAGATPG